MPFHPLFACRPALENTARLPVGASYRQAAMFQWIPSEVIALANCQQTGQKSLILNARNVAHWLMPMESFTVPPTAWFSVNWLVPFAAVAMISSVRALIG